MARTFIKSDTDNARTEMTETLGCGGVKNTPAQMIRNLDNVRITQGY